MNLSELGTRIKRLRLERAMSQQELAKAANISQSTVTQLEKGIKDPTLTTLKGLAVAFNLPISKILAEEGIVVFDLIELTNKNFRANDLEPQDYVNLDKIIKAAKRFGFV